MKTALETLFETTNGNADYISVNNCLGAMKAYGRQCAEQALKDASDNLDEWPYENLATFEATQQGILSTPIQTP